MASCLKPTIAGGRGLDVVTDPGGGPICRFTSLLGRCGRGGGVNLDAGLWHLELVDLGGGGVEFGAKSCLEGRKVGSPV